MAAGGTQLWQSLRLDEFRRWPVFQPFSAVSEHGSKEDLKCVFPNIKSEFRSWK